MLTRHTPYLGISFKQFAFKFNSDSKLGCYLCFLSLEASMQWHCKPPHFVITWCLLIDHTATKKLKKTHPMSILGFPKMNKKLNILFKNHRRILCFFYIILVSFAFAYKYSNCVYSVKVCLFKLLLFGGVGRLTNCSWYQKNCT